VQGTSDTTAFSELALSRLACHWLLTQLSDQDVLELLRLLGPKWHAHRHLMNFPLATIASTGEHQSSTDVATARSADAGEDLVVYKEKTDRKTVEWILGLSKKK
jgi:hypothetical protein